MAGRCFSSYSGKPSTARRGGPSGRPWIETYSHNSAATSYYQLWGWDNGKRAHVARKEWDGPYPEKMRFVLPPGGLPRAR